MRMDIALSFVVAGLVTVAACNTESSKSTPAATPPATTVAPDSQQNAPVFREMPVREALPEIGRRYNVKFDLASNALGERRLTTDIGDESLERVLTMLEAVLDAEIAQTAPGRYTVRDKSSTPSS